MAIRDEMLQVLRDYTDGARSLAALRQWRREHIHAIHESGDPGAESLYAVLAGLLAEYAIGDLAEEDLRADLHRALDEEATRPGVREGTVRTAVPTAGAEVGTA
jgi:hypothetical protein